MLPGPCNPRWSPSSWRQSFWSPLSPTTAPPKVHPQHAILLPVASPRLVAPTLTAAGNHLMQWHLPLIHPLVLTSVLACQRLANYRSCQNNYWERKTNFPFNHFSPYSTSLPWHPVSLHFIPTVPAPLEKSSLGTWTVTARPRWSRWATPMPLGPPAYWGWGQSWTRPEVGALEASSLPGVKMK